MEQDIHPARSLAREISMPMLAKAHPGMLRKIYQNGRSPRPDEIPPRARGKVLSIGAREGVFFALRPLIYAFGLGPWQGKIFDPSGSTGANRVFWMRMFRFDIAEARSRIDGKGTMVLRYSGQGNIWPADHFEDEVRIVAPNLAIAPGFYLGSRGAKFLLWSGLSW